MNRWQKREWTMKKWVLFAVMAEVGAVWKHRRGHVMNEWFCMINFNNLCTIWATTQSPQKAPLLSTKHTLIHSPSHLCTFLWSFLKVSSKTLSQPSFNFNVRKRLLLVTFEVPPFFSHFLLHKFSRIWKMMETSIIYLFIYLY